MWLVSVSVMLAVFQCGSSEGGSPRLPTRMTPPFRGASALNAAPVATSRIAAAESKAFRTGTEPLIRVPPQGSRDECVDFAPTWEGLSTSGWAGRTAGREPPEGQVPLRLMSGGKAYGTVMVVPSPVAVMVKVPAVLDAYAYAPQAGVPPGGGAGTAAMNGPALWLRPLTAAEVRSVRAVGIAPMWAA